MPAHALPNQQPHTKQLRRSQATIATRRQDKHNPVISSIISSFESGTNLAHSPRSSKLSGDEDTESSYDAIIARATSRMGTRTLRRSTSHGMGLDTLNEAGRSHQNSVDLHGDGEAAEFPVIRTSRGPQARTSRNRGQLTPNSFKAHLSPATRESKSALSLNAALDTIRFKANRSNSSLGSRSPTHQPSSSLKSARDDDASLSTVSGSIRPPSDISLSAVSEAVRQSSSQPADGPLGRQSPRLRDDSANTIASGTSTEGPKAATTSLHSTTPTLAKERPARLYLQDTSEELDNMAPRDRIVTPAATTTSSPALGSPHLSSIGGTIPLRKSSLDQTSSPPRQRQRSSKSKDSERKKRPDSHRSWSGRKISKIEAHKAAITLAGLDDQDATVKRIKELRQIRQDRLTKESAAAEDNNSDEILSTDVNPIVSSPTGRKSTTETVTRMPRGEAAAAHKEQKAHQVFALGSSIIGAKHLQGDQLSSTELVTNIHPHHTSRPSATTTASAPITPDSIDTDTALRLTSRAPHARPTDALKASQHRNEPLKPLPSTPPRPPHGGLHEPLSLTRSSTSRSPRPPLIKCDSDDHERRSSPDTSLLDEIKGRARRSSMNDDYYSPILDDEELQERRKSVTTSVDAYLKAPRLSQRVRCPKDGRLITFSEVGDPAGAAVIVCVGMGLTRYITAFYDELAATLGLRLITLDRPGVGGSEPYRERERVGPLSWPDDVLAVTQHLRISQFSLLAHSAGAIYALATALTLPQCVRGKVHLLAPWIPPSQFDTFGIKDLSPDATPVGALPRSQRLLRVLPIPFLKAANGGLFAPASIKPASVKNSPDSLRRSKSKRRPDPVRRESLLLMDQVIPERPVNNMFSMPEAAEDDMTNPGAARGPSLSLSLAATASPVDPDFMFVTEAMEAAGHAARERQVAYSSLLTEQTWILATRNANAAVDLIVCLERHRDIGFRYVDIQRQIVIVHGSEDKRVPVENIRWISEQINKRAATNRSADDKDGDGKRGGCEVRVLSGEGHGLMASPAVMMDVLTDISSYWKTPKW